MKDQSLRVGIRLGVAWIFVSGLTFAVHAGPPRASQEQARTAIEDARQVRDALQTHLAPTPTVVERDDSTRGSRRRPTTGARARRSTVAPQVEARGTQARVLQHAQRSLVRISEHLEVAEQSLERNPDLALHRVDLALHELHKAERRLGIELEPDEVQP
jgi:hypothetical protein